MPGEPHIQKVEYPAYLDNNPANLDLASGKAQWGSQFIPNIKSFYLSKSKDNHNWSPPVTQRRDLPEPRPVAQGRPARWRSGRRSRPRSTATQIAAIGEGGQQPAANQTGVVIPTFQQVLRLSGAGRVRLRQARTSPRPTQLMASAGYSTVASR